MIKKTYTLVLILLLLLPSFSLASNHGSSTSSGDSAFDFGKFVSKIIGVGQLTFLGSSDNQFVGFIRILMAILLFTILYFLLSMIPGLTRGVGIAIGILLAVLVSVFLPKDVLIAWGTSYATLFAFVIIFGPVIGLAVLLISTPTPGRVAALVKLASVLILWWLVAHISTWGHELGSYVAPLAAGVI
ncbi:hypothetical protein HY495_02545 [Candidatus Woesearchaeota archaeon]|nr:hypothetical protein [Candidatus Woesearchaeota archaeon]